MSGAAFLGALVGAMWGLAVAVIGDAYRVRWWGQLLILATGWAFVAGLLFAMGVR